MKNLLLDLLKLQTTADKPSELSKALDLIECEFTELPQVKISRVERNGVESLVISTESKKHFHKLLCGHIDVVSASPEQFNPVESDGKVYARGASDMKGVVVAMIEAYKDLVQTGEARGVALMISTDEEVGGFDGVGYLVEELGYSSDIIFLPDDSRGGWDICTDEKGILHFVVEASGKSGHGSRPWEGDNAILKSFSLFQEIKDTLSDQYGLQSSSEGWGVSISLGQISGGRSINSIPDYAKMSIDIRFPGEIVKEEVSELVEKICQTAGAVVTYNVLSSANHVELENTEIGKWIEIVKEVVGVDPKAYKTTGGSDARFFAQKDIPVLMTKPICSNIHIDGEWVDYQSLVQFKEVLVNWLKS